MSPSIEGSLRPEFTAALAHKLLAGACINLVSPHGQGRRRTLADLRAVLPDALQIFQIDMRIHKDDYQGFYDNLHVQLGCPTMDTNQITLLLDLLEESAQPCLLILHNFDELRHRKAVKGGYNSHFMHALNSIPGRTNIGLLCVSECAHQHYLLSADGAMLPGSNLQAEVIQLPPLTRKQLLAELLSRNITLPDEELSALASYLLKHDSPYTEICRLENSP